MKAENNQNWEINSQMDMTTLKQLFIRVSDDSRMSANTFAVYGDICLYGPTTRRQVWERRNWKVSGVDRSFQKLITWGLLECKQEDGKNIYFVKTS